MEAIQFNGWFTLLRTVVVGVLAYSGWYCFFAFQGSERLRG